MSINTMKMVLMTTIAMIFCVYVQADTTFWLTDQSDGTPVPDAMLLLAQGETTTLYAFMDTSDSGNTFEMMVGYDTSTAASYGLVGDAATHKLTLVSTAAQIADSIHAQFTTGRTVNFGSAREAMNTALGGRPYGIQVYGGFEGEDVIGQQLLFSFVIKNEMTSANDFQWIVISNAGQGASFTTGWKRGTSTARGDYQLKVAAVASSVCGDALHPYPMGDLNKNCYVDLADLAELGSNWMLAGCELLNWCDGADINLDSVVDLLDFAALAGNWQTCTDPEPPCSYNP